MSNMQRVPVGIVYHEGGNSYRPFIIIDVPLQYNWVSPTISFFQSSGRSGDNSLENELRRDTWFPTIGLLVEGSSLYTHLRSVDEENTNMYTNGYIIKLNAQLNGGLWQKYPVLRNIALNYDINEYDLNPGFVKRDTPLLEIHVDSHVNKEDNASPNINEVNQYLAEKYALYDFSNISFPAKEVRIKLLKNQPQIIETKIPKTKTKRVTPPYIKPKNTAYKSAKKTKPKPNTTRKSK